MTTQHGFILAAGAVAYNTIIGLPPPLHHPATPATQRVHAAIRAKLYWEIAN